MSNIPLEHTPAQALLNHLFLSSCFFKNWDFWVYSKVPAIRLGDFLTLDFLRKNSNKKKSKVPLFSKKRRKFQALENKICRDFCSSAKKSDGHVDTGKRFSPIFSDGQGNMSSAAVDAMKLLGSTKIGSHLNGTCFFCFPFFFWSVVFLSWLRLFFLYKRI